MFQQPQADPWLSLLSANSSSWRPKTHNNYEYLRIWNVV